MENGSERGFLSFFFLGETEPEEGGGGEGGGGKDKEHKSWREKTGRVPTIINKKHFTPQKTKGKGKEKGKNSTARKWGDVKNTQIKDQATKVPNRTREIKTDEV